MLGKRRNSRRGSIDGGEGRGIQLSERDNFDLDDTLVDDDPPGTFADLDEEGDSSPSDRRRDPLRRKI